MNVLYVSPNGYIGGAESFVLEIARMHSSEGSYHPTILFFNDGKAVTEAQKLGLKTYVLKNSFRMRNPISVLKAIREIRKFLKENDFQLIHETMPYAHIIMTFSRLFTGIKSVWFQHGPVGTVFDKIGALLPTDLVMFNSFYLQKEHNRMVSVNDDSLQKKIHAVVPFNESNPDEVQSIRQKYLGGEGLLIGMAGRVTSWKGFHNYLEAIKKFNPGINKSIHFLLIGSSNSPEDKRYEESLALFIKENGLSNHVTMTGFVDSVENYMSALDVFVHASTIPEPFGLIVAEMMLHKTFVIGSSRGGINEILKDGETGLTFDSTSSNAPQLLCDQLKKAIHLLEEKTSTANQITDQAYSHISKNYNLKSVLAEVEESYDQLLSK